MSNPVLFVLISLRKLSCCSKRTISACERCLLVYVVNLINTLSSKIGYDPPWSHTKGNFLFSITRLATCALSRIGQSGLKWIKFKPDLARLVGQNENKLLRAYLPTYIGKKICHQELKTSPIWSQCQKQNLV